MKKKVISAVLAAAMIAAPSSSITATALDSSRSYKPAAYTFKDSYLNKEHSVDISTSGGVKYAYDVKRGILNAEFPKYGNKYPIQNSQPLLMSAEETTPLSLAALYQTERADDFFKSLGFEGPSRDDGFLYVGTEEKNPSNPNGTATAGHNFVYVDENHINCFDVTAHEYTHMITLNKLNWRESHNYYENEWCNEALALTDAYSDILGKLAQFSVEGGNDWKIAHGAFGNANFYYRDIANPSNKKTKNGNSFQTVYNANIVDSSEPICLSTIVSHAAYKMLYPSSCSYVKALSKDDLAYIWYNSIDNLSRFRENQQKQMTFADCRAAVEYTAKAYLFYSNTFDDAVKKYNCITKAFDDAKIPKSESYSVSYEVSQAAAQSTWYVNSFLQNTKNKFVNGKYWNNGKVNSYTSAACNHARYGLQKCNCVKSPVILDSNHIYYNMTEDDYEYYQCAGFARKLQMDFFKTDIFTRYTYTENFTLRPGDHVRIAPFRYRQLEHSIFVYKVEGDTVTYADCNAGETCEINLYRTATIKRDSYGNMIGLRTGNTDQKIIWIERPVMCGDVNGDSCVDYGDLRTLQRYIAMVRPLGDAANTAMGSFLLACDVNGDKLVDYNDYNTLKEIIDSNNFYRLNYITCKYLEQ